ncbi:hypothetical protein NIES3585_45240 [Nodularia sp. NIES-3585]|nr:hypothetical protein NIES3585_45240 [Nodularia sp. NIES-3585]
MGRVTLRYIWSERQLRLISLEFNWFITKIIKLLIKEGTPLFFCAKDYLELNGVKYFGNY